MARFILLLGGVLALLLAVGAITMAAYPHRYQAAELVDPAVLSTHLQKFRTEQVLP
jgi:hypothetical protein